MSRVIVTGNRDYTAEHEVVAAIRSLPRGSVVVHGGCPTGADAMANSAALAYGHLLHLYIADWEHHGKSAGPKRNQRMIDAGADEVFAFGDLERGGKRTGTGDCVARARRAGIPVRHWP